MTKEEAITKLHWLKAELIKGTDLNEPLDMAIEALQIDIVYCYECKYNGSCCQCVDIIDDLLSLNFCGRGARKEAEE